MSKATWHVAAGAVAVAAALALPVGAAYATTSPSPAVNQGNTSVASDNQALIPLNIPVDICGNAVAILGSAQAGCQGGAVAQSARAGSGGTASGTNTGNTSVGSGNKVTAPVTVPVDVCGASIGVLGTAKSSCRGGATAGGPPSGPTMPAPKPRHHKPRPRHHKPPSKHHRHGGSKRSATLTSTAHNLQNARTAAALGSLPTTGANLAGILAGALGLLGAGAGVVFAGRRRQAREEA